MDIKGYTYGFSPCRKGLYLTPEAYRSRELLMADGINWVCLAFYVEQERYNSTEILYDYSRNVSDHELEETIRHFHENGVKVCFKPMVNSKDHIWRARIGFPEDAVQYWDAWFASYTAFLEHYAEIAERTKCEMFCMGCEMLATERQEMRWRKTIEAVRALYHGELTYNTNHGHEDDAAWIDEMGYLGTSAYFPVEAAPGGSLEEMQASWEKIADELEALSKRKNKDILFMEIGCRSAKGCAQMPWDFEHMEFPWDEEEQARFYESCLSVMTRRPWFKGVFWWDWSTTIYDTDEEARKDIGFNIHRKKAEQVMKQYYNA